MSTERDPATGTETIAMHTVGLATLASDHPLSTAVPTCGNWTLADLTWHLAEVQSFWGWTIANRPAGPEHYSPPERPPDSELVDQLRSSHDALQAALAGADPLDAAWSWSDDHTVAFTLRRQSHEAFVHHVDCVLAVDGDLPDVTPRFAADGIDELVTVMLSGVPAWAEFERTEGVVDLIATDTGDRWRLAFGRMTGTSPRSGETYDLVALEQLDRDSEEGPTTTISATAVVLDLWLWGRHGITGIEIVGDPNGADRLREAVVESSQ